MRVCEQIYNAIRARKLVSPIGVDPEYLNAIRTSSQGGAKQRAVVAIAGALEPDAIEAKGEVPDITALPPGCPFEPRCPFAHDRCRERLPDLVETAPGDPNLARCVLYYPDAAERQPERVAQVRSAALA